MPRAPRVSPRLLCVQVSWFGGWEVDALQLVGGLKCGVERRGFGVWCCGLRVKVVTSRVWASGLQVGFEVPDLVSRVQDLDLKAED